MLLQGTNDAPAVVIYLPRATSSNCQTEHCCHAHSILEVRAMMTLPYLSQANVGDVLSSFTELGQSLFVNSCTQQTLQHVTSYGRADLLVRVAATNKGARAGDRLLLNLALPLLIVLVVWYDAQGGPVVLSSSS